MLADLPRSVNYIAGERVVIPILVSNYAKALPHATLNVRINMGSKVLVRREVRISDLECGRITELYKLAFTMPRCETPAALKLTATLGGGDTDANNEWELYVFPRRSSTLPTKKAMSEKGVIIADDMSADELLSAMRMGKRVLLFSAGPFARLNNSFQISVAGRTEGHLATVIADSPLMRDFPHEGFCSWQFRDMMKDSHATALDLPTAQFAPIIEIASSYKNARREALVFEYAVGDGRLLVSTLNLPEGDAGAAWLKARMIEYVMGDEFDPQVRLSESELYLLANAERLASGENSNAAMNANDITMRVKKK